VYQKAFACALEAAGLKFRQHVSVPVLGAPAGFRADFIIEDTLLVELKSLERLLPVHRAQVLSYLRLSGLRQGLLINFNVSLLKHGIRRVLNTR
jgi:GxxExxY protein